MDSNIGSAALAAGEGFTNRRGPGRPKGLPKTGGRQRGQHNHVSAGTKHDIRGVLDRNSGKVWRRIVAVAMGHKVRLGRREATYPSEAFQRDCLRLIANKTLPDRAAHQLTGTGDKPLFPEGITDRELASWIAVKLSIADDGQKEPAELDRTSDAIEAGASHDAAERIGLDDAEQSQAESAAASKPVTTQPAMAPLDYNERLLRYTADQIEAQNTRRARVVLRRGYRR